jgi:hypothetical protein
MPFGIKSAQEVFQKRIAQNFDNMEGVELDIDDILSWAKVKRNTTKDLELFYRSARTLTSLSTRKSACSTNQKLFILGMLSHRIE